jgi:hypothetical protein
MKIIILAIILVLGFIKCIDNSSTNDKNRKGSVMGTFSINSLPNFYLERKTAQVEIDTLGYFFIANPPINKGKLIAEIENAEIFHYYPNGGRLRETTRFCSAKVKPSGLEIIFQGSPNPYFNRIMTLSFSGTNVSAKYIMPTYENGQIINDCSIYTDSLHLDLDKYPVKKGDLLRGYLSYKGWKDCTIQKENNRIVGERLLYGGYFECKVE